MDTAGIIEKDLEKKIDSLRFLYDAFVKEIEDLKNESLDIHIEHGKA